MKQYLSGEATVFSSRKDSNAEFDFVLPEYLPNITRIVKADADIEKCTFRTESAQAFLDVDTKFSIIFISDFASKIKCVPFHETITVNLGECIDDEQQAVTIPSAYITSITTKLISPRKIHLGCTCHASAAKYAEMQKELFDEDCGDKICIQKSDLEICRKTTLPESFFESETEITLDSAKSAIGEIIYSYAAFLKASCRVQNGFLEFDGTFLLHILYEISSDEAENTDGSSYTFITTPITVSESIESNAIKEDQSAFINLDICDVSTSLSFDPYGENRIINVNLKYNACAMLYEKDDVSITTDAFCENRKSSAQISDITVEKIADTISETVHASQPIRTDTKDISEISDCGAKILCVTIEHGEGSFFAAAKCLVQLLGTNPSGELWAADCATTFKIPIKACDSKGDNILPDVLLSIKDCSAKIKEGELYIDADFEITGVILEKLSTKIVTKLSIDENDDGENRNGQITVYYPDTDDSLWVIAKKYSTNPDSIMKANGLETQDISDRKIIIIP